MYNVSNISMVIILKKNVINIKRIKYYAILKLKSVKTIHLFKEE